MKQTLNTSRLILLTILLFVSICILVLVKLNTQFDSNYWINFSNNILTNLIVVGIALLVIEKIIERSRVIKYKEINTYKSEIILSNIRILEFKLLEFLDVVSKKNIERKLDETLKNINSTFKNNLTNGQLINKLWQKIDTAKNKTQVIDKFTKILEDEGKGILDLMKSIFPQPDPEILIIFEKEIPYLIGNFEVSKLMINIEKKAKQYKSTQSFKITALQKKALLHVSFETIEPFILKVLQNVIKAEKFASEDKLFLNV